MTLSAQTVRPGDVLFVQVVGAKTTPTGSLGRRPLIFYAQGSHHEAIAAIPLETPEGPLEASVQTGGPTPLVQRVTVTQAHFAEKTLTVESRFAEPPAEVKERTTSDKRAVHAAESLPLGPRLFTRTFIWPRPPRFTGHFGDKRTYNGKLANQHYAADLSGRVGDEVVATNDGRVTLVRDCYLTGNTIVLAHGAGIYSTYAHLSRVDVREGEIVRAGGLLGAVGRSGRATGPHLHFAVHADGLYVNPESLVTLSFPDK
jgi:murein DD-endopeptidase MepM/ murein hydrolase activator NlpD